jgi:dTDP-4-dehydrorhamnose 3,5-epimerase
MNLIKTGIEGLFILEPKVFGDNRGWFYESYSKRTLEELGITTEFVQDNRSYSSQKGTLRGLHCQINPDAQAKLLTCTRGKIFDVAVDIREGSPTYLKWVGVELSDENKNQFFIPRGFLHGFATLTDDVEVLYKTNSFYSPQNDRSVCYSDPDIGVEWPVDNPVVSQKDAAAPLLKNSDIHFKY